MTLTPIGSILKKIALERNWEERFEATGVWDHWDEVVGTVIAQQAQPKSLKQGCLWVGVSDPMWMHHLQMSKEVICKNLNAKLGSPMVKDIRFTLSPPSPHKDAPSQGNTSEADHR